VCVCVIIKLMFILGFRYSLKWTVKCLLYDFGQANMAIYLSRRNEIEESLDLEINSVFFRMVKARLKVDFDTYSTRGVHKHLVF